MDIAQPHKTFLVQFLQPKSSTDTHLILSSFLVSSLFIVLLSIGMNHVFLYFIIVSLLSHWFEHCHQFQLFFVCLSNFLPLLLFNVYLHCPLCHPYPVLVFQCFCISQISWASSSFLQIACLIISSGRVHDIFQRIQGKLIFTATLLPFKR